MYFLRWLFEALQASWLAHSWTHLGSQTCFFAIVTLIVLEFPLDTWSTAFKLGLRSSLSMRYQWFGVWVWDLGFFSEIFWLIAGSNSNSPWAFQRYPLLALKCHTIHSRDYCWYYDPYCLLKLYMTSTIPLSWFLTHKMQYLKVVP